MLFIMSKTKTVVSLNEVICPCALNCTNLLLEAVTSNDPALTLRFSILRPAICVKLEPCEVKVMKNFKTLFIQMGKYHA